MSKVRVICNSVIYYDTLDDIPPDVANECVGLWLSDIDECTIDSSVFVKLKELRLKRCNVVWYSGSFPYLTSLSIVGFCYMDTLISPCLDNCELLYNPNVDDILYEIRNANLVKTLRIGVRNNIDIIDISYYVNLFDLEIYCHGLVEVSAIELKISSDLSRSLRHLRIDDGFVASPIKFVLSDDCVVKLISNKEFDMYRGKKFNRYLSSSKHWSSLCRDIIASKYFYRRSLVANYHWMKDIISNIDELIKLDKINT